MKEIATTIEYRGEKYKAVFDLNVMEEIQDEYGSLEKWDDLMHGKDGEPNAKAIKFGFTAMLNEGIDIDNDEHDAKRKPLTLKQVGRMITEIGLHNVAGKIEETVIASTKSDEKNG